MWSKKDDLPPLEGDEKKVKEGKGLQISTPNKLLTRLPVLSLKTKAVNNSYKLKSEIRKTLYLLYQHNKISKKVCNNLIKKYCNNGRKYGCKKTTKNVLFLFTFYLWLAKKYWWEFEAWKWIAQKKQWVCSWE